MQSGAVRIDLEAEPVQCLQRRPVRIEYGRAAGEQQVRVEVEAPGRRDGRVQHPERAGGHVARIGVRRLVLGQLLRVQPLERRPRHHDLAAHLEIGGDAGCVQRL